MKYYGSVNNKISGRKSAYFNVKNLKKNTPVYGSRREYKGNSIFDLVIKWITAILLIGVVSALVYIFSVDFVSM